MSFTLQPATKDWRRVLNDMAEEEIISYIFVGDIFVGIIF